MTVEARLRSLSPIQLQMFTVAIAVSVLLLGSCGLPFLIYDKTHPSPPPPPNTAVIPADRLSDPYWAAHHQAILDRNKQGNVNLLIIGDSITDNYSKTSPPAPPNENFHPIWLQYYEPRGAVNMGISGDTTANLLWRFQNGELDGIKPKVAVILIGTNNLTVLSQNPLWKNIQGIEFDVEELHRRLPQTKVLLLGVLPRAGNPQWKSDIPYINTALERHFLHSSYVTFLDISSTFTMPTSAGFIPDPSLYYDPLLPHAADTPPHPALHPNNIGQRKMAEAIEPTLQMLLAQ
jgi:lysophospholipase L1-like esterase